MRFVVDECVGPTVARSLEEHGHDALSIFQHFRGMNDEEILRLAVAEERIIITNDKDFGMRIVRDRHAHRGVVLIRLADERSLAAIGVLSTLLDVYANALPDRFVVVTDTAIRFARSQ